MKKKTFGIVITLSLIVLALYLSFGQSGSKNRADALSEANDPKSQNTNSEQEQQDSSDLEEDLAEELLGETPSAQRPEKQAEVSPSFPVTREQFHLTTRAFFSHLTGHAGQADVTPNGHDAPTYVVEAAAMLREISEIALQNPSLKSDAVPFYRSCASGSSFPSAIRSLCYFQLKEAAPEQAAEISERLGEEIKEIRDLL